MHLGRWVNSSYERSCRQVCSNSLSTAPECQLYFSIEVLGCNTDLQTFEMQERLELTEERAERILSHSLVYKMAISQANIGHKKNTFSGVYGICSDNFCEILMMLIV